ncbi:MAG TPA: PQQ-dependent sugar dehydrogenase [Pirellulales bacterium]|jgi:glucose/arabinose dehydrogenase|nr:PQQ-dependent sugar dehydrogenase [Pirellulales bacterium]
MIRIAAIVLLLSARAGAAELSPVTPVVKGLVNPESVCVGGDGKTVVYYVTTIGEFDKPGDGSVARVQPGKIETFATGLDDPKGIVAVKDGFLVTDVRRVVRVDPEGKVSVFAAAEAFPIPPLFLNDIDVDDTGNVYVTDTGDRKGAGGGLFRIAPDGKVTTVLHQSQGAPLVGPNGVMVDDKEHVLLADFLAGKVYRVKLADGSLETIAEGFLGADGLARDYDGNLYLSQWLTGDVSVLPVGTKTWQKLSTGAFQSAADICINYGTGHVVVPDMKGGTLSTVALKNNNPTDVDTAPLGTVAIRQAWPEIEIPRPIVLTHAGDHSGRVFVASQYGRVYILPADEAVSEAKLFFDLKPRVVYKDTENEEGFLGMAFHPKFSENGQFFAYYTSTAGEHLSVISRFRVDPKNPDFAEMSSEEEILRIPQPYWNHNGGTLAFGPDGYLYVGLGDGGKRDDPQRNGQNPAALLGSILRIDVDHQDSGKAYAIPKDNPFAGRSDAAPENYSKGWRNIWRMSFDRATGALWAADVGQDIWEEINVVQPGGNYGWNLRESMHRFGRDGSGPRPNLIDPIWEYHHDIGKSITGGYVYRGSKVPDLQGKYLYADYVTGRVWALAYDRETKRVISNREIAGNISPVMSFGEDQAGEVYFLTVQGRIFRFAEK